MLLSLRFENVAPAEPGSLPSVAWTSARTRRGALKLRCGEGDAEAGSAGRRPANATSDQQHGDQGPSVGDVAGAADDSVPRDLLVEVALPLTTLPIWVNPAWIVKLSVIPAYAPVPWETASEAALRNATPEHPTLLALNLMFLFSLVVSTVKEPS